MNRLPIIHALMCRTALLVALAGCSIEQALPELDYKATDRAQNSDWPQLVDQREFSRDYASAREIAAEASIETLLNRVEALRARAKFLQRPVITQRERSRLTRAVASG